MLLPASAGLIIIHYQIATDGEGGT